MPTTYERLCDLGCQQPTKGCVTYVLGFHNLRKNVWRFCSLLKVTRTPIRLNAPKVSPLLSSASELHILFIHPHMHHTHPGCDQWLRANLSRTLQVGHGARWRVESGSSFRWGHTYKKRWYHHIHIMRGSIDLDRWSFSSPSIRTRGLPEIALFPWSVYHFNSKKQIVGPSGHAWWV